jgi:hypothetical protein
MYVYYTSSTEWTRKNRSLFRKVLLLLKDLDFKNTNDYVNYLLENIPNPDEDKKDFHIRVRKRIKKADLLIADISNPSVTLGTLIEYAINNNIPVLSLVEKKYKHDTPSLIKHYDSRLFTLLEYEKQNIDTVLKKYFENFRKGKIKFNAFITPELDSYMNWYSKKFHISKSDFVRELIFQKMKSDKDYKKILPDK